MQAVQVRLGCGRPVRLREKCPGELDWREAEAVSKGQGSSLHQWQKFEGDVGAADLPDNNR